MNDAIRNQIESLDTLRLPELQARYAEVLGEATRCPNKAFLIRRITEALEARVDSATPEETAPAETAPTDAATTEAGTSPRRVHWGAKFSPDGFAVGRVYWKPRR